MINKKLTEKPQLASISADALIHVVEPNDFSQSPDGSSYKFPASDLSLAGQDNIDIRKYVTITSADTTQDIVDKINALPSYTVDEQQSVWFVTRQKQLIYPYAPARTLKYKMLNKGKGTYGSGQTQLVSSDLELLYNNTESTTDIEDDPTTDIIDYGSLTGETIYEWLNAQDPAIVIQAQSAGYTLFEGTIDGTEVTYLWIGEPGVYGDGETQSVISDFQELSNNIPEPVLNRWKKITVTAGQETAGEIQDADFIDASMDYIMSKAGGFMTEDGGDYTFDSATGTITMGVKEGEIFYPHYTK